MPPFAVLAIALCAVRAAVAADVSDPAAGYTLRVPFDWKRIPDAQLRQMRAALSKPGVPGPNFIAAYEPAAHRTSFTYPYLLVQQESYGSNVNVGTISRSELDSMVAEISGTPVSSLTKGFSDDAAKMLSNATIGKPTVTTSPPGFVMGTRLTVQGVGQVRGQSYCVLGRTNGVFLHFYAKENEWPMYAGLVEGLAASFGRTPDQTVTVGQTTTSTDGKPLSEGFDWQRVWATALVGGVIGGVVGALGWLNHRRNKAATS